MSLAFNEEQRALKITAREFIQDRTPITAFRTLRDSGNPLGFSQNIWESMVELGWSGTIFPEVYGGFDFGCKGLAGCMEELGRALVCSPLLSSVVLAGSCVFYVGSEQQKQTLLPTIINGEKLFSLALDESFFHQPNVVATTAKKQGDSFVIEGTKTRVIDGTVADTLIVAARTAGAVEDKTGISLFIVDSKTAGIHIEKISTIDSRAYAKIRFDKVCVPSGQLLGELHQSFAALDKALDRARICLAAEMFGGMQEIFERTVQYLKERKQFGTLIGTFQSLQHRAAHMYTEIQICKSIFMLALDALEKEADNAPQLISAAKAKIADTYELVSNEATQMHGGIGVTDELDIGLFLKRARVSAELLGSARFHYSRYAALEGF